MGLMERFFARDSSFAEKSCELMCAYRSVARALAVVLSPDLPVPVSNRVALHTWPAYRGAMGVLFSDWQCALQCLAERSVPVTLAAGTEDDSQVPGLNGELARLYPNVSVTPVRNAAHIVPFTHAPACVQLLLAR